MPLEETKKPVSVQRYRQKTSTRFGSHSDAREAFDKIPEGVRKRLRKRNNPKGVFDVLVFEKIKGKTNVVDEGVKKGPTDAAE